MGESYPERYPMCQDQPAQIDCRVEECAYYRGSLKCANTSPAITLSAWGGYVCWSKTTLEELDAERQALTAEEETMEVMAVPEASFILVTTNQGEWLEYRRYGANDWERHIEGDGTLEGEYAAGALEAAYQEFMQQDCAGPAPEVKRAVPQYLFYRRLGPGAWEGTNVGGAWSLVDDTAMLAELERHYQSSMPTEKLEDVLKDPRQRYTDDFEWKAPREIEFAQAKEMLTYLAGIGGVFYPSWDWMAFDTVYSSLFRRDHRGLKVRQWRGQGFSTHGLLTNGGKWGVILVISEEELVRLWLQSSRHKLEFAKQITRETIEHARLVAEGAPYPEFVPTIKHCEEDANTNASAA